MAAWKAMAAPLTACWAPEYIYPATPIAPEAMLAMRLWGGGKAPPPGGSWLGNVPPEAPPKGGPEAPPEGGRSCGEGAMGDMGVETAVWKELLLEKGGCC